MEFKNKEDIDLVLNALGEQLSAINNGHIDILVCGGSALHALGLVTRTTKDVDVVAIVSHNSSDRLTLETAQPLPQNLVDAAQKVERDFQLKDGWINPGPTSALDLGLPEGVLNRAETLKYGKYLTVRFISRYDQIHFKLYAAVDQGGKHYQDLIALKPTAEELENAARWSMTHDVSEGYRNTLKDMLIKMGYKNVADRI